jgi:Flp pilus assembly pilin Flp
MKTVTYLKAGLVSKAAIEPKLEESGSDKKENKEERKMDLFSKLYVKARERFVRFHRGQTMTEYALILAAIAIIVYAAYKTMGNDISSLASGIDSDLTSA